MISITPPQATANPEMLPMLWVQADKPAPPAVRENGRVLKGESVSPASATHFHPSVLSVQIAYHQMSSTMIAHLARLVRPATARTRIAQAAPAAPALQLHVQGQTASSAVTVASARQTSGRTACTRPAHWIFPRLANAWPAHSRMWSALIARRAPRAVQAKNRMIRGQDVTFVSA